MWVPSSVLISVVAVLWVAPEARAQNGMSSIGTAIEAFSPCKNGALAMNREIGGPPKTENYWDGVLNLGDWPSITEVRVSLTVDNPAKVEIDPSEGRVLVTNRTFHMSFFGSPPTLRRVKFTIRGRPFGQFPNVVGLTLNNADICPAPAKWRPSILGLTNTGSTVDQGEGGVDAGGGSPDSDGGSPPGAAMSTCGVRKIQHEGLITHGFNTAPGDFPWHVALFHRDRRSLTYKCGGSILNPTTILTAGHCLYDATGRVIVPDRMIIQVGRFKLYSADANGAEYQVHRLHLHPEYRPETLANDLAILKLSNPISFNNYIQPVCLWERAQIPVRNIEFKRGIVTGWGYTELDELSDELRQATMPVVPFTDCLQSNRDFFGFFLSDKNFCAGYRNGTSVCNGDSGGGMVFAENNVYRLRGIVSVSMKREGKDFCNTSHYVIFTDAAKYLDWIESQAG